MSLPPPRPHRDGHHWPVQQHHVVEPPLRTAPTLGQYWRSDVRVVPGRRRPKWAGRAAFWLGLLAAVLFFAGNVVSDLPAELSAYAAPVSLVAVVFALVAIIAGIGRGLGIVGLIFALAGNTFFWAWLDRTFG